MSRLRTSLNVLLVCGTLGSWSVPAFAQTATVTFYSHGSYLTSGIPGTRRDVYDGNIFDGPQGLFAFRDGFFVHNNRFLTLRLPSGSHVLGASFGKKPLPRESLSLNLIAGEHYFILVQGETEGVPGVFTVEHGKLHLMSCEDAVEEMKRAAPLKEKALWRYTFARKNELVVSEAVPPPCPDASIPARPDADASAIPASTQPSSASDTSPHPVTIPPA